MRLEAGDDGMTIDAIGWRLYAVDRPTKNQRDSIRVRLRRLVDRGEVERHGDRYTVPFMGGPETD